MHFLRSFFQILCLSSSALAGPTTSQMVGFSFLSGRTPRQIRDAMREAGIKESILDSFPPTPAGMEALIKHVKAPPGVTGPIQRVLQQEEYDWSGLLDKMEPALSKTKAERSGSERKQTPKSTESILRAARDARRLGGDGGKKQYLAEVIYFCGFPKRVSSINVNVSSRSESLDLQFADRH